MGEDHQKVMFGCKGIRNIFDKNSFERFAKAKGYLPVTLKAWSKVAAKNELVRRVKNLQPNTPYIIYGYSLGAETGRDAILDGGLVPERFIAVGAYIKARRLDEIKVPFDYYGDASSDPKRGKLIIDPKTGKPCQHFRTQEVVADMAEQGSI